jgi:methylthioxylose transferase
VARAKPSVEPVETTRVARWLAGSAVAIVVIANLSQMSRAEVERIWLPFVPWLLISCALLPERWRRWGLAGQVITALVVQHLLWTDW